MYKCLDCNCRFGNPAKRQSVGEFWGMPFSEIDEGCPECGGQFDEIDFCNICGKEFYKFELLHGVCDDCINAVKHDFDECYKISEFDETTTVELNALLASLFDNSDVEAILRNYLRLSQSAIDCSEYVDNNREFIAKKLNAKGGVRR